MNYTDQQALIAEFNKQTGLNYEVPNVLDAVICDVSMAGAFTLAQIPGFRWKEYILLWS